MSKWEPLTSAGVSDVRNGSTPTAWSLLWPTAVFTGFGVLFVARDPVVRGLTLGPVLVLLISVAVLAWRSTRVPPGGERPSPGETDAWNTAQIFLAAVIFLQMIAPGRVGEGWITWCLLFAYGGLVLLAPEIRTRRMAAQARHRGVMVDERDAAIQAVATRWAKRTLETLVVACAAVYVLYASRFGALPDARTAVTSVFTLMFVANGIGQWRAALLYWRDRR